ncbi:MAG TPA: oxidoreductase [Gammaproteobacteria bacterium]|nr:oxidoreductase [Gammaproteobacteria bacterium]
MVFGFLKRNKVSQDPHPVEIRTATGGSPKTIEVKPKESILQAALAAGIPFPHSCRVGSCLSCRCKLVEGDVKQLTDTSYVLSEEELREGYILACQAQPRSAVVVEVSELEDDMEMVQEKVIDGTIAKTEALTHDIIAVTIQLEQPMQYTAGQYADVSVPGVIEEARSYSFAEPPLPGGNSQVTFHIRHVPGGVLTDWIHAEDRIGTAVKVDGPLGTFHLKASRKPMLCIAGGSGMAPLKAILEHAATQNCTREVVYLYGARTQKDVYCEKEMTAIRNRWSGKFEFIPVLSEEPEDSDWQGPRGMVTDFVGQQDFDVAEASAYMCGPPPMIDAAMKVLEDKGMPESEIHYDKFLDKSHEHG